MSRPTGAYIPPAKRVKNEPLDPGSAEHQRSCWDENKKNIIGLINRANTSNVSTIVQELFKCNLIRYKGLFASALIKAQEVSPVYTDIYAAILAIINCRLRPIGSLVVNRIILNYRLAIKNQDKSRCLNSVSFIAHLINQDVVHESLAIQILDHLLYKPNLIDIEIAIAFIKDVGAKLDKLDSTSRELVGVFKTLRNLAHESDIDSRTQAMIDQVHLVRREQFQSFPALKPDLDLIDEDDKVTHEINLSDPRKEDYMTEANYFKIDPKWAENEAKYGDFKKRLLESDTSSSESGSLSSDECEEEDTKPGKSVEIEDSKADVKPNIIDTTGTDSVEFRRKVYLILRNSIRHEEVVHKLLKLKIDPELYDELCEMMIDICGQERTFDSILGMTAAKLCNIKRREFASRFETIFKFFYETVHKFDNNKIRNIARFYANLLVTESIDWSCLKCLRLRENATSSAGRCFIKFLFAELISMLSMSVLLEYIKDPSREEAFSELFPKDEDQDIRFAINFFTGCGFGELTEVLREILVSRQ